MFFLLVVLKVPIVGSIYLLWWASQPKPEPEPVGNDDHGDDHGRRRPLPKYPRGPRRGPHGGGAKPVAETPHGGRTRQLEAARALERSRSRETVRK